MKNVKYHKGAVVVPLIGAILLLLLFICIKDLNAKNRELRMNEVGSNLGRRDVEQFRDASHYLTDQARLFVATADMQYLDNYFNEVEVLRNREKALEQLGDGVDEETEAAFKYLQSAYTSSEELMKQEIYAMKLICINNNADMASMPRYIVDYNVSNVEMNLSDADRLKLANNVVNGNEYIRIQGEINYKVDITTRFILSHLEDKVALGNLRIDVCVFKVRTVGIILCSYVVICVLMYLQMLFKIDKAKEDDEEVDIVEYLLDDELEVEKNNKGFTYLELGSYILIAIIVLAVISPTISQHVAKTRDLNCISNAVAFKEAVDLALIDATLGESSNVTSGELGATYHAYDSRVNPPDANNSYAQIVWKASKDFPVEAEFSVIALVEGNAVYQVVYRDIATGHIYVWYNAGPAGEALQNAEYLNGFNSWHMFDSAQNEDWVGKYTNITTDVCWNGRD